jgi:hypothetical protein
LRQAGVWDGATFPVGALVGGMLPGLSSKAHAGMDRAAKVRPISTILSDKVNSSTFASTAFRAAKCVGWIIGKRLLCAGQSTPISLESSQVLDDGAVWLRYRLHNG